MAFICLLIFASYESTNGLHLLQPLKLQQDIKITNDNRPILAEIEERL